MTFNILSDCWIIKSDPENWKKKKKKWNTTIQFLDLSHAVQRGWRRGLVTVFSEPGNVFFDISLLVVSRPAKERQTGGSDCRRSHVLGGEWGACRPNLYVAWIQTYLCVVKSTTAGFIITQTASSFDWKWFGGHAVISVFTHEPMGAENPKIRHVLTVYQPLYQAPCKIIWWTRKDKNNVRRTELFSQTDYNCVSVYWRCLAR